MKLHLHTDLAQFSITGHGAGFVAVNGREIRVPIAISLDKLIEPWKILGSEVGPADFLHLLAEKPSIVLFGSGARFKLPSPAILAALYQQGVGFEAMDTPAACRTYNVLVSEGRRVIAALLV